MWRRLDVWKKYVQILVFQFIKKKKKDNWLIGIAKEKAGLPCHLTPTHKHQVLNLLKGNSGQNLNVWASLLLSPQLTPVLNLSFLMRYYVQVVSLLLSVNMMSFHYCYKVNYLIVFVIKKKKQQTVPWQHVMGVHASLGRSQSISMSSWPLSRNLKKSARHDVREVSYCRRKGTWRSLEMQRSKPHLWHWQKASVVQTELG